ncbi:MAG: ankyrin repeat domain-containing protein [Candidatus Riflebacteria bacterium]
MLRILIILFFLSSSLLNAALKDIHQLAAEGNLEEIRICIRNDRRMTDLKDELGRTPLHIATINGHLSAVNVLIKDGAEVNAKDRLKGFTPLHYASFYNYPKIVKFLLSRRADTQIQDNDGFFPLHLAAANGCSSIVEVLLDHRADPNSLNRFRQTPLHLAALAGSLRDCFPFASTQKKDYLRTAELLLQNGAYCNERDFQDDNPATIAMRHFPGSDFQKQFVDLLEYWKRLR